MKLALLLLLILIPASSLAQPDDQELEMEIMNPYLKEVRENFEGTKTNGMIDLKDKSNYNFTQFALTQLVNGYAIFHFSGPDSNPASKTTIAVKQSALSKKVVKGNMTYQVALTTGLPLTTATTGKCLRYSKDQTWDSQSGFPLKVKTYSVVDCKN